MSPRLTLNISASKLTVLFEEQVKGRWKGRTPTNKLVFVESDDDLRGKDRARHRHLDGTLVNAGQLDTATGHFVVMPIETECPLYHKTLWRS